MNNSTTKGTLEALKAWLAPIEPGLTDKMVIAALFDWMVEAEEFSIMDCYGPCFEVMRGVNSWTVQIGDGANADSTAEGPELLSVAVRAVKGFTSALIYWKRPKKLRKITTALRKKLESV